VSKSNEEEAREREREREAAQIVAQTKEIERFIAADTKKPQGQTTEERKALLAETARLYSDLDPKDLREQNRLYELNRDRNALRKQLFERHNPKKTFDIKKIRLPPKVRKSKAHKSWARLHGGCADMLAEIEQLTHLLDRDFDPVDMHTTARGKFFNFCDGCFQRGEPRLNSCSFQVMWCGVKKEFRLHCIQKRYSLNEKAIVNTPILDSNKRPKKKQKQKHQAPEAHWWHTTVPTASTVADVGKPSPLMPLSVLLPAGSEIAEQTVEV